MLVVSDTSPLTALLQIGKANLLAALFGRVLIPPGVRDELLQFHSSLPDYMETRGIENRHAADVLGQDLDRGEAEAIVLAEESRADYLLMDEKRGRAIAKARGLDVIGLLGVLLKARKAGLTPSLAACIDELESRRVLRIRRGETPHFDGGRRIAVTVYGQQEASLPMGAVSS